MNFDDVIHYLKLYFAYPNIFSIHGDEASNLKIDRQKHKILYLGQNKEFIKRLVPQKYLKFAEDYNEFKGENLF